MLPGGPLQHPDSNRIIKPPSSTPRFTGVKTDESANGREGYFLPNDCQRLIGFPVSDELDIARHINTCWTELAAWGFKEAGAALRVLT